MRYGSLADHSRHSRLPAAGWLVVMIVGFVTVLWPGMFAAAQAPAMRPASPIITPDMVGVESEPFEGSLTLEERLYRVERLLKSIKDTGERAEERSLFNKLVGMELANSVQAILVVLIVIAAGFPLTVWFLTRKRILGLSGLSSEMAATLIAVEERQAKLVAIFKEIQSELEYLHSAASPDLKNFMTQATELLRKNEEELQKTGPEKETGQ